MTGGDDAGFERLTREVSARAGLALESYKDRCLRRRVGVRMRACGVQTYQDYLGVLERTPGELERLVDVLTINVTRFFRNPETWQRLDQLVVRPLLRGPASAIRVWSAGCASGEEPYTLAMVFLAAAEAEGHPEWFDRVTISATDIDAESLARARKACYAETAFVEAPTGTRERCFVPQGDGHWRVAEPLRRRVRVLRHDLLRDPPPAPPYHLIVCRNVVIYFDRPGQDRLMECFRQALVPGGVLVLGKVETILGATRQQFESLDLRERFFRRPA